MDIMIAKMLKCSAVAFESMPCFLQEPRLMSTLKNMRKVESLSLFQLPSNGNYGHYCDVSSHGFREDWSKT